MDMPSDHSDAPARGSRDFHIPQFDWKIFEEELGYSVIGFPSSQQLIVFIAQIHSQLLRLTPGIVEKAVDVQPGSVVKRAVRFEVQ